MNTENPDNEQSLTNRFNLIAIGLAIAGVAVSIYTVVHHLAVRASGATDFACNINQTFSCDSVALSKYAEIGDVPLGVFGAAFFFTLLTLLGFSFWKEKYKNENRPLYAIMVFLGVATSIGLAVISMTQIKALCISCIAVYIITLAQAVNLGLHWRVFSPQFNFKNLFNGAFTAAISFVLVMIVYNSYNSTRGNDSSSQTTAQNSSDHHSEAPKPGQQNLLSISNEIPLNRSAYSGLGEDFRKGGDDAKVVITEFADFQCPACKQASDLMGMIYNEYRDRVLIVFKNYPLDKSCNSGVSSQIHPFACRAAVLARCAGESGKFWQYHDAVFAKQREINNNVLDEIAKQVGLNDSQIKNCLESKDILAKVKEDITQGGRYGVDATPTIYINGRKFVGNRNLAVFRREIDRLLTN